MKVRKFNESGHWNQVTLVKFLDERAQMYIRVQNLFRRAEEFLAHHSELLPTELQDDIKNSDNGADAFDVFDIKEDSGDIKIYFHYNDGDDHDSICLEKDDIEEFTDYMNDITIYDDMKNYNL